MGSMNGFIRATVAGARRGAALAGRRVRVAEAGQARRGRRVTVHRAGRCRLLDNVLRCCARCAIDGTGAGVIRWRCTGFCRRVTRPAMRITHPDGAHRADPVQPEAAQDEHAQDQRGRPQRAKSLPGGPRARHAPAGERGRRHRLRGPGGPCAPSTPTPVTPASPTRPAPVATPTPTPTVAPDPTPVPPVNHPDGRLAAGVASRPVPRPGQRVGQRPRRARRRPHRAGARRRAARSAEAAAGIFAAAFGQHAFDFQVPVRSNRHKICVQAVNVGGGADVMLAECRELAEVGDFNEDGYVGCYDVSFLKSEYGQTAARARRRPQQRRDGQHLRPVDSARPFPRRARRPGPRP